MDSHARTDHVGLIWLERRGMTMCGDYGLSTCDCNQICISTRSSFFIKKKEFLPIESDPLNQQEFKVSSFRASRLESSVRQIRFLKEKVYPFSKFYDPQS
jgi:hypothetical protein